MFDLTTPLDQLPFSVQRLSDEARQLWLTAYVEAYEQTGDELKAELAGWGAIKREDMLTQLGMKSMEDGRIIVGGWAALLTDADNTDLSEAQTYFDELTEFALEYYANAPLFYEHDGDYGIIGKRCAYKAYPRGIWLEHELHPNSPHFSKIASELERGVLFYSTDSIEHFVQSGYDPKDSHLRLWYLAGCSLTKTPAEPGLGPVTTLAGVVDAIKSAQGTRKVSADEEATTQIVNPQDNPVKDTEVMDPKQLAEMLGLAETATQEEVVAKLQSLLETATKMNSMNEEDEEAIKSLEAVELVRDALTQEGAEPPTDEELRTILQSALESLGVVVETEMEMEAPLVATASMKSAGQSIREALKNSPIVAKNKPGHVVNEEKRATGTKSRGFGSFIQKIPAKKVIADGMLALVRQDNAGMKSLGYTVGTNGGWLVNREISEELLPYFYANSAVAQAGVTIKDMKGIDVLEYERQLTGATAYWAGEGQLTPDGSPTYGKVSLTLREAVAEITLANKLLKTSNRDLESELNTDLQTAISLLIDLSALRGSGGKPSGSTGREFVGLLNIDGVTKTTIGTGNGKTPSPKDFVDAWGRIEDANVPMNGKWGLVGSPRTSRFLKNTTDANGNLVPDNRYTQGHPIYATTQVPNTLTVGTSSDCTEVYFGAWEYMYMGVGQDLEFVADYSVNRKTREVLIQVVMSADVCVSHPQAFQVLKGVRP